MKYIRLLFFLLQMNVVLVAQSYTESLDCLISEKIVELGSFSKDIKNIIYAIQAMIKKEVSLQDIDNFLDQDNRLLFSLFDTINYQIISDDISILEELKIALSAQLYMHYLECSQQKMLYIAVKNYDALHYWRHEQFEENRSFYQKKISRWFLRSAYRDKIEKNIIVLQEISKETNSFLGLLKHNQYLLEQAQTQEEFITKLMQAVQIQDKFFHALVQNYECYDIETILKREIDQTIQFSLNISCLYGQSQLPSHFERHWESYALLAAVVCASGFIYQTYQKEIMQGSQYFWEYHVKRPIEQIKNIVSGLTDIPKIDSLPLEDDKKLLAELNEVGAAISEVYGQAVSLDQANKEFLNEATGGEFSKQSEQMKILYEKIQELMQHFADYEVNIAECEKKIEQEGAPIVSVTGSDALARLILTSDRIKDIKKDIGSVNVLRDLSKRIAKTISEFDVMKNSVASSNNWKPTPPVDTSGWTLEQKKEKAFENDCMILANPEKNIKNLPGAYHRMIMRQIVDMKQQTNLFVDETNHFVQELYTDNRLVLGAIAFIPAATLCGSSFFASKKIYSSVAYQPIRRFIREVEILLNNCFYQLKEFENEGSLYFLTEQLKLHVGVLTATEQKLIETDIAQLQATYLDYVQKFNIIQRMYRTYPCLMPAV